MSKLHLKKLLNVTEIPEVLIFSDRFEYCCRNLVWTTVKSHLKEGIEVHYLCFSIDPSACSQALGEGFGNSLRTYDLYHDPLQWNTTSVEKISGNLSFNEIINLSNFDDSEKKIVVVIDDINTAANYTSEVNIFRNIQILKNAKCVSQVIIYCHDDASPQSFISSLANLFPSSIRVNPTTPPSCKILLKKKSGKILKSVEEFSINEKYDLQYCRGTNSKPCSISVEDENDSTLKFGTSFNLALTDTQKEARNKLILPHTRIQSTGGQIHYVPDATDDWDDEDPDEDLEI